MAPKTKPKYNAKSHLKEIAATEKHMSEAQTRIDEAHARVKEAERLIAAAQPKRGKK